MDNLRALAATDASLWRLEGHQPTATRNPQRCGASSDWVRGMTSPKYVLPALFDELNNADLEPNQNDIKVLKELRGRIEALHNHYNTQVTALGSFLGGYGDIKTNSDSLFNIINERLYCLITGTRFDPNEFHMDQHQVINKIYEILVNPNPTQDELYFLNEQLHNLLPYGDDTLRNFYRTFAALNYPTAIYRHAQFEHHQPTQLGNSSLQQAIINVYASSSSPSNRTMNPAFDHYVRAADAGVLEARKTLDDLWNHDTLGFFNVSAEVRYPYICQCAAWSDFYAGQQAFCQIFGYGTEQNLPAAQVLAKTLVDKQKAAGLDSSYEESLVRIAEIIQITPLQVTPEMVESYRTHLSKVTHEQHLLAYNQMLADRGSAVATYVNYLESLSNSEHAGLEKLQAAADANLAPACYDLADLYFQLGTTEGSASEDQQGHLASSYFYADKVSDVDDRALLIKAKLIWGRYYPDDKHQYWSDQAMSWAGKLVESNNTETRKLAEESIAKSGREALKVLPYPADVVLAACAPNGDPDLNRLKHRCIIGYMLETGTIVPQNAARAKLYHPDMVTIFEREGRKEEQAQKFSRALWFYKAAAQRGGDQGAYRASRIIEMDLTDEGGAQAALDVLRRPAESPSLLMKGYAQRAELRRKLNNGRHTPESTQDLLTAARRGHYLSMLRLLALCKNSIQRLPQVSSEEYQRWDAALASSWHRLKDRYHNANSSHHTPIASYEGLEELVAASSLWHSSRFRDPIQALIKAFENKDQTRFEAFPKHDRLLNRLGMIKRLIDTSPDPKAAFELAKRVVYGDKEPTLEHLDAFVKLLELSSQFLNESQPQQNPAPQLPSVSSSYPPLSTYSSASSSSSWPVSSNYEAWKDN